jgi:Glycosyltransferase family 87
VPIALSRNQFAWLALLCLPLTVQSLNNGQANLIVVAAMLATVAAVCQGRWNLAAVFMALAFVCKIYPLALGLLLIGLYPRQLSWRIGLAVVVSMLAPFLLQHPSYVLDQYDKWIVLLRADDRTSATAENMHRDLWLLVDIYALPVSRPLYRLLQIGAGAGVAALLWWRQRHGWSNKALLTSTLALAVTWMLALGPVVESSTFVLLAPSFACSIVAALQGPWRWRNLLLAVSALLFVLAASAGSIANTAKLHVIGLHPWATLLYFAFLLSEPRPHAEQSVQPASNLPAAA